MNSVTSKMKHFSTIVAKSCNSNVTELLFATLQCNRFILYLSKSIQLVQVQGKVYWNSIWKDYKTTAVKPNFIKVKALLKWSLIQTISYALVGIRKLWILDNPNKLFLQWKGNINYEITFASIKLPQVLSTLLKWIPKRIETIYLRNIFAFFIFLYIVHSPKVNNRNRRKRCERYAKLAINTPESPHRRRSGIFIANFEYISYPLEI